MADIEKYSMNEQAAIIRKRSAFAAYVHGGMQRVIECYPDGIDFVNAYKYKTLHEVDEMLTNQMNHLNSAVNGQSLLAKVAS